MAALTGCAKALAAFGAPIPATPPAQLAAALAAAGARGPTIISALNQALLTGCCADRLLGQLIQAQR